MTSQLGFWEAPEAPPMAPAPRVEKRARYYQAEAIDAIERAFAGTAETPAIRRALLVFATGLGKTFVFSQVCKRRKGRVLVIAHRDELITQAREELERATGELVGTEKAEQYCGRERIVVTSIQTMSKRKDRFKADDWSLIVVDEGHRAVAPSYTQVMDYFSGAQVLLVTATPDRSDEKGLRAVVDECVYVMDIEDGIDAGYLVPVEGVEVVLDEIDLSNVSTVNGDLAQGELDEAMLKAVEGVAQKTVELTGEEQCIVFCPGVRSAHAMCERLNLLKPGKAIAIDGKTDKMVRRSLVSAFKRGEYQYLANCDVATEGWDSPATSVVAMASPTKSRGRYAQRAGRGTRVLPGVVDHVPGKEGSDYRRQLIAQSKKPRMRILDFVGNAGKHTLVTPVDVLGANYTEDEVKLAKKKLSAEPGEDIQTALKDARKELKALAARMHAAKLKVSARTGAFDPFATLGMDRSDAIDIRFGGRPASEKQVALLVSRGLPAKELEGIDQRAASRLIAKSFARQDAGLASLKQLRLLSQFTPVADTITTKQASAALEYIIGECNYGRLKKVDPQRLGQLLEGK